MAVTYLLEAQEGIARRDSGVLKITTTSGEPPSAIGILERYGIHPLSGRLPAPER
jgi:hypothetical protein